ncbi:GAF domain-containing protein [uncultured Friedmanniella sp.]|uniref:GAF domain-containing protein n=1 Tax=uncultured Friedmanniella sp. TaxID=335381 RepID=UPI0035CA86CC
MTESGGGSVPVTEVDDGSRSEAEYELEEHDLRAGLDGLGRLGSVRLPLSELLDRVAGFATKAIPGADGAGLTLLEEGRGRTVVASVPFVAAIEEVQYELGEGPCLTAAVEARTVVSGSLGADPRWRRFGGRVARMGVHSALSLPLITPDGVIGAINVYSFGKGAFDRRAAEVGELYAVPAAIAVQNAQALEQAQRLALQLTTTLEDRLMIERAVGIVMSRSGVDQAEALRRLRTLSQHEHQKLVEVARTLVDEAVRRARSQHG